MLRHKHPYARAPRVSGLRRLLRRAFEFYARAAPRARGLGYRLLLGYPFERAGKHLRLSGMDSITIGENFRVGDGCWIDAIESYRGQRCRPRLVIGSWVSFSNWSHVSCAARIVIGDGCLIGSKVYIGDHRHGIYAKDRAGKAGAAFAYPTQMPLADLAEIEIGEGSWIGDGAVILGGSRIAAGSIIGANSVVHLQEPRAALIAGVPARVLAYLDHPPSSE